ncbi:hypothetical protein ACHAXT_007484 [Thalassiosira profunda]
MSGYGGGGYGGAGSGGGSAQHAHNGHTHTPQHAPGPGQSSSMTIDEMRALHRAALSDAESKRTELRLVLASRYRELVGSSDEVLHMRERAEELHGLVGALPGLVDKVAACREAEEGKGAGEGPRKLFAEEGEAGESEHASPQEEGASAQEGSCSSPAAARADLARLPRTIHRCLDEGDVHGAASFLVALFDLVAARSDAFPMAAALSPKGSPKGGGEPTALSPNGKKSPPNPPALEVQMKMACLHAQSLPARSVKLARGILLRSAAREGRGAHATAAALSALDLLDVRRASAPEAARAARLMDLYYDSKAKLLDRLLDKLALPSAVSAAEAAGVTNAAERILSRIVRVLQRDVILHPYMIFVLRRFPVHINGEGEGKKSANEQIVNEIMATLPRFDPALLQAKASRFLAAHLPLIRTKAQSVLRIIAGTTASKLGQIRQTLYDTTDGDECLRALDDNGGACSWDAAVRGMVDVRVVGHGNDQERNDAGAFAAGGEAAGGDAHGPPSKTAATSTSTRRFSLWGALFSRTFSSLVHSLLAAAFHSVHSRAASALRASLARAPPFQTMMPHEARRNALRIATDLDAALRRVSDDAHELLVHAEERAESERRLRQSLYVQTCEIMGRLLGELRRMLASGTDGGGTTGDATTALIVGRLCHLLKFRLMSLPALLDPASSPAALGTGGAKGGGMIALMELRGAFDLADDDDDGLISFDEAMEAMESAFSGTHFHGAEMVRDTLLLPHSSDGAADGSAEVAGHSPAGAAAPRDVTLAELALLAARGLRHDPTGPGSALGTVQSSLDDIVARCFRGWARAALEKPLASLATALREGRDTAATASELEWRRLKGLVDEEDDVLLREIGDAKGDLGGIGCGRSAAGDVSPHVVSYLLAVAGVLNRSVCPADSLPPVPSSEYAATLGISTSGDDEIPNMMVTIRGALLGEALTSVSRSLQREILGASPDDIGTLDEGEDVLKKCGPSSLVQLLLDVRFVHRCFFERNTHGFVSLTADSINASRATIEELSDRISAGMKSALGGNGRSSAASVDSAMRDRHSQVFVASDLFLSSLFGEDDGASSAALTNGAVGGALSSTQEFILNPLPSSRRFILLPIQAEKSLTELQLRGKYGKKAQEEKGGKDVASGNAIGAGLGFLSSMLTKNR